jgi:hypothetical protein
LAKKEGECQISAIFLRNIFYKDVCCFVLYRQWNREMRELNKDFKQQLAHSGQQLRKEKLNNI